MKYIKTILVSLAVLLPLTASATRNIHVIESGNLHCNDTIVVYSPDISEHCCGAACCAQDGFTDSWYINKTDHTNMK